MTPGFIQHLTNYPPGESGRAVASSVTVRCPHADCPEHEEYRAVAGHSELGIWSADDEHAMQCPMCGADAEIVPS